MDKLKNSSKNLKIKRAINDVGLINIVNTVEDESETNNF